MSKPTKFLLLLITTLGKQPLKPVKSEILVILTPLTPSVMDRGSPMSQRRPERWGLCGEQTSKRPSNAEILGPSFSESGIRLGKMFPFLILCLPL